MSAAAPAPLAGTRIAITRPVGSGAALARRVRALGGEALLLPGSRLRACPDAAAARAGLRTALGAAVVIFTSPAAVRFAAALTRLDTGARVLAPGSGTATALQRAGVTAVHPQREDSEGLLALPALQCVRGQHVALVGAAGGRGLLERELAARGARVSLAYVYQRAPARLDRRHAAALLRHPERALFVLLTSAQALTHILAALPPAARTALLAGTAIGSSGRLLDAARAAGFAQAWPAASAHADDLLAAVLRGRP